MGNLIKKRYFLLLMYLKLMIQQNTNPDVMNPIEKATKEFFDSKNFFLSDSINLLHEKYQYDQKMDTNETWTKKIAIKTENLNKTERNIILEFTLFVNDNTESCCITQIKVFTNSLAFDIKELSKISEGTKNSNYLARFNSSLIKGIMNKFWGSKQEVEETGVTLDMTDDNVINLPYSKSLLDFCIFFIEKFRYLNNQEEARDKYKDLILKLKNFIN